jgi:tRNA(fMet)-specific endonuclease VapC
MPLKVLDTDISTLYLHGHPHVVAHVADEVEDVRLPIVTAQEMVSGWLPLLTRQQPPEQYVRAYAGLRRSINFFSQFPLLDFDLAAAHEYARLRATYRRLGSNDLRIAAIALLQRAHLITRNQQDFAQIEGLTIEDWSQ